MPQQFYSFSLSNPVMSGLYMAQYFKYKQQFKLSSIEKPVDFKRVAAKSMYVKHRRIFDSFVKVFQKHKLDHLKYIDFFITECNKYEKDIDDEFMNVGTFNRFIGFLEVAEQKRKVFKWFMKSVNNIVEDCIEGGFASSKDYFRQLFKEKRLANYYLTGKISKYWFAAIPTFKQVVSKMDELSKEEFKDVYESFDIYNTEINEAFLRERSCKVNPFKFTDEVLSQRLRVKK